MAETPISSLASLLKANINISEDFLNIVDFSDKSMSANGTNKKVTVSDLVGCITDDIQSDLALLAVNTTNSIVSLETNKLDEADFLFANLGSKPTTLSGYGITDAQPVNNNLTEISALTTQTYGRSLLTQLNASAARTTLGLGTIATENGSLANYLPLAGGTLTGQLNGTTGLFTGEVNLATDAIGSNGITVGGTGGNSNYIALRRPRETMGEFGIAYANGVGTRVYTYFGHDLQLGHMAYMRASFTPRLSIVGADNSIVLSPNDLVEQRNGVNAQRFNLYGTYTDASNYRRLYLSSTTAGAFTIGVEGLGTGASGNTLTLLSNTVQIGGATNGLNVQSNGTTQFWSGGNINFNVNGNSMIIGGSLFGDPANQSCAIGWSNSHVATGISVGFRYGGTTQVNLQGTHAGAFQDLALRRLVFEGNTSSFPMIRRNGAAINFRLADDSADAPIIASNLTLSGIATINGGTQNGTSIQLSGSTAFGPYGLSNGWTFVQTSAANIRLSAGGIVLQSGRTLAWGNAFTDTGTTQLWEDASHVIAQRNGTNPQILRIYNAFTDASNYDRGFIRWNSNVFEIGTERLGSYTTTRALSFVLQGQFAGGVLPGEYAGIGIRTSHPGGQRGVYLGNGSGSLGYYAAAIGWEASSSASFAQTFGAFTTSDIDGRTVICPGQGPVHAQGQRTGLQTLSAQTTNAIPTPLAIPNMVGPGTHDAVPIATDHSCTIRGCVVAVRDNNSETASFNVDACIQNNGGTVTLVSSSVTQTSNNGNVWAITVNANNTTKRWELLCTGEAGKNIRWSGVFLVAQVAY